MTSQPNSGVQGEKARAARLLNADISAIPVELASTLLPAELIQEDEVVILLLRPSLWYIPLSSFGSLVFIALITFMLAYVSRFSWVNWSDLLAFSFGFALATLRLSWQALEWYSRVYVLTDRRIIRRMGVLRVAVLATQRQNIQHSGSYRWVRGRVCGLGAIGCATSGSDVFEALWVMISRPFAVHRIVVKTIEKYGK